MVKRINSRKEFKRTRFKPCESYVLTSDIDFRGKEIGNIVEFRGVLDGNGYCIMNFSNETGPDNMILNNSGVIKNLRIEDIKVQSEERVGGICSVNDGEILNCHVSGNLKSESDVGGIVAKNNGTVKDSTFEGYLENKDNKRVGGIVGNNLGLVEECFSSGNIKGGFRIGGIVGQNNEIVKSCSSETKVENNQDPSGPIGGIVGRNYGEIRDSYFDGEFKTDNNSEMEGLVVGKNCNTIRNCHSINVKRDYPLVGDGFSIVENTSFKDSKKEIKKAIIANKI